MKHLRFLLATQLFLVLAFLLPVLVSLRVDSPMIGIGSMATWFIAAYASYRLAVLAIAGKKKLINLTFWIFAYVWLGITPMLQLMAGEFPLAGSYTMTNVVYTSIVILAGLIAFEVGDKIYQAGDDKSSFIDRMVFDRQLDPTRTILVSVAGMMVALFLVNRLGGLSAVLVTRGELTRQVMEVAGDSGLANLLLFLTFLRVPAFVAMILTLAVLVFHRRTPGLAALLVVLVLTNLLINNPVNSPRYWIGTIVISLFFLLAPWRSAYSFSAWAMGIVLSLLFFFPYADLFRRKISANNAELPTDWNPLVEKSDYDAFQQLMNALNYVADNGITYGKQILGTVFFWVPRTVWADKPIPSGQLIAQSAGYRDTNLSFPLWGEAYLDGGIFAVILVFLLYGLLTGKVERMYLQNEGRRHNYLTPLVPVFAAYQFFLLRGALMSALAYFIPIVTLFVIATVGKRAEDDEAIVVIDTPAPTDESTRGPQSVAPRATGTA